MQKLVKKTYNIYKPTTSTDSLHNETNNNRIKMIQFATCKGFNARSITFPHKHIHKETWYSAEGRKVNQTDNVLIINRFRISVTDIRVLRGPDIVSDHNLVRINFKVKLRVKTEKKYNEKRKFANIFQNSKWKQEYAIEHNNRFEILENVEDEDNIDSNIKPGLLYLGLTVIRLNTSLSRRVCKSGYKRQ